MKFSYVLVFCFLLFACGRSDPPDSEHDGDEPVPPIGNPIVMPSLPGDQPSHPSQGKKEQPTGYYAKGKLKRASALPASGRGYVKILRPRARNYGSSDLVYVITQTAKELQRRAPSRDRVQIGDMSGKKGGFAYGHNSHQNGLDADIAFLRMDQKEQDPNSTTGFHETFVKDGQVTTNFDLPRNWLLAKLFIESGRVQRIFVNDVLKQEICRHAAIKGEFAAQRETLRRLRSYEGHMDHYHIRLTCPLQSPNCQAQEEPEEAGTGCNNE